MNEPMNVVLSVQDRTIVIRCADKSKFKILKQLGAKRKLFARYKWILVHDSKNKLSVQFACLRDQGFVFSGGTNGWPPSTIFQNLKDEGYICGNALEVVWKNKDSFVIREIE